VGRHHPQDGFPLLLKFLDARERLSVQVHPNDEQAAQLDPPDRGKSEAWVILDADPGSVLYAGLEPGVDRAELERAVAEGTTDACLSRVEPQVGDCAFLPAGVVHAVGEGLLIAEIQQASDTTYRLFDWNRVGRDGRPRELHVAAALDVIDYDYGPVRLQSPKPGGRPFIERLVECEKFVLDRWRLEAPQTIGGDDRFHIVAIVDGSVAVAGDPSGQRLRRGQTTLLPAAAGGVAIAPNGPTVLLDMYLP
jgi:mannose-6-phosphate isomerase